MQIYDFSELIAHILAPIFGFFRWEWIDGVPNHQSIQDHVEEYAKKLIEDDKIDSISCGRIRLEKRYDGENFEGVEALLELGTLWSDDLKKLKKDIQEV